MIPVQTALKIAIFADGMCEQMPEISANYEDFAEDKAEELLGRRLTEEEITQVYNMSELAVCEQCFHHVDHSVMWDGICDNCASDSEEE